MWLKTIDWAEDDEGKDQEDKEGASRTEEGLRSRQTKS